MGFKLKKKWKGKLIFQSGKSASSVLEPEVNKKYVLELPYPYLYVTIHQELSLQTLLRKWMLSSFLGGIPPLKNINCGFDHFCSPDHAWWSFEYS